MKLKAWVVWEQHDHELCDTPLAERLARLIVMPAEIAKGWRGPTMTSTGGRPQLIEAATPESAAKKFMKGRYRGSYRPIFVTVTSTQAEADRADK